MAWMSIWGIIWLVLVGLAIWALVRWVDRRTSAPGPTSDLSAMEVLRQRYARGEIGATTFEQMRERLEASTTRDATPAGRA